MTTPSPIDVHFGSRIRKARTARKVTQEALGEALGVSFQQVQKFESGKNRIAASQLFVVAQALEVAVSYFFWGLPKGSKASRTGRGRRTTP